jgi:hypothetical protein
MPITSYRRKPYAAGMSLPASARAMSTAELQAASPQQIIDELDAGGAILVITTDDPPSLLGVLTRDRDILGEATLAAAIARGDIPPLADLLDQ